MYPERVNTFVISNGDLVLPAGALINSRHIQNAVGIQVKSHLNLRHTSRRWWNSTQLKLAKNVVVLGHGTLTLVDLDQHAGLVVGVCRERLRLLCRNRRVAFDE